MARKEFAHHEAVSALVREDQGGYSAAIAVKALDGMSAPRFHKILDGQLFKTADDADDAAAQRITSSWGRKRCSRCTAQASQNPD